jgi:hypothetical protein
MSRGRVASPARLTRRLMTSRVAPDSASGSAMPPRPRRRDAVRRQSAAPAASRLAGTAPLACRRERICLCRLERSRAGDRFRRRSAARRRFAPASGPATARATACETDGTLRSRCSESAPVSPAATPPIPNATWLRCRAVPTLVATAHPTRKHAGQSSLPPERVGGAARIGACVLQRSIVSASRTSTRRAPDGSRSRTREGMT